MRRYYFDIDDGEHVTHDDEGHAFASRQAVREAAIGALPELVRDQLPCGDRRDFIVKVRDQEGRYVFQARLALTAGWLDEPPA